MIRSAEAYADQLVRLLPPGRAWPRGTDSTLGRLAAGMAQALARIDERGDRLLDETTPDTALELLPDWERLAGLPDECVAAPDSLGERQVATASRIAAAGGQSRAHFIRLAATLGYQTRIEEFRPFVAGGRAAERVQGEDWAFAWRMIVLPTGQARTVGRGTAFGAGSRAGGRLQGFGSLNVECVIARARPAHTTLLFAYPAVPEPVFWADFTKD